MILDHIKNRQTHFVSEKNGNADIKTLDQSHEAQVECYQFVCAGTASVKLFDDFEMLWKVEM